MSCARGARRARAETCAAEASPRTSAGRVHSRPRMQRMLNVLLVICALGTGCYTEAQVQYPYVAGPDLVVVEPGVEVVAGFDYPVVFVDGAYWLWWGGYWYSSPYWNHGWRYRPDVPPHVRGIAHPERFAHYFPLQGHPIRRAPGYSTRPTPGYGPHPRRFVGPPRRG